MRRPALQCASWSPFLGVCGMRHHKGCGRLSVHTLKMQHLLKGLKKNTADNIIKPKDLDKFFNYNSEVEGETGNLGEKSPGRSPRSSSQPRRPCRSVA